MRTRLPHPQRGFSVIELLVAAFIMGIGLLGLATLQVMTIRTSGTSSRMSDAVRIGEMVMEQASAEGTQSLLGLKYGGAGAGPTTYVSMGGPLTQFYAYGTPTSSSQGAGPIVQVNSASGAVFTVVVRRTVQTNSVGFGGISRFDVDVTFTEVVNTSPVTRTVRNFREVAHA